MSKPAFQLLCRVALSLMLLILSSGPVRAQDLLHALWTDKELAGSNRDRLVTRPWSGPPDTTPPALQTPDTVLPPVPAGLQGVIRRVRIEDGEKVLALTFDLCERASNRTGYRREIVNYLRSHEVPATFFAGGKWMRSHPEQTLQLMADPLFELGNHSWTHADMAVLDENETHQQVLWTQAEYEILRKDLSRRATALGLGQGMDAVPRFLSLFRLPYGRNAAATLTRLEALGLPVVQWDVLGEDGNPSPAVTVWRVVRQVRPGSIILMHANAVPKMTHKVIPLLVDALRRDGWRFVTVSELLGMGPAESVQNGYFEHPGDNVQYDRCPGKGTLAPHP